MGEEMGIVHRQVGPYRWEGVNLRRYPPEKEMQGVSVKLLIGPAEGAENFVLRYFEIEPGGWTAQDVHAHDHGVFILRGRGQVQLGEQVIDISSGDVVYIPPNEAHQIHNTGDEPFGFLCVIPPKEQQ